jgi:hypothetical protein
MRIKLPLFDHKLTPDTKVDGHVLQAIRTAADDFLDVDPTGLPCEDKQSSHEYKALRQGDVIFVRIDFKPESCGRTVGMLDAGATYAIGVDGKILRRELDGVGPW